MTLSNVSPVKSYLTCGCPNFDSFFLPPASGEVMVQLTLHQSPPISNQKQQRQSCVKEIGRIRI